VHSAFPVSAWFGCEHGSRFESFDTTMAQSGGEKKNKRGGVGVGGG